MKKTILYVITQGERGGAQRYVFDLATNLADTHDVSIAVGEQEGDKTLQSKLKTQNSKLKIIELKHLVRQISPINDILAVLELAKIYKTLKPDIIHLNSSKVGIIGSFARLMAYGLRLRVVYTVHGWVFNEPNRKFGKWLYRWLEKFTARWKDKIIVLSDRDFDDGVKLGIDKNKLIKIPLEIEMPGFLDREEAKKQIVKLLNCQIADNCKIIGTIANLYKTKGLDVLVEAIKILNAKYKIQDIKFIIIGEGPERKNLKNLIKKYKLEKTIYLIGTIENAAQYLKAFDLFVLPSRKEGLPYTILEAMSAGLPIVSTDVGGVKELIPDAIIPDNPEILAEKIITTIKNPILQSKNIPSLEKMLEKTKIIYSSGYQAEPYL